MAEWTAPAVAQVPEGETLGGEAGEVEHGDDVPSLGVTPVLVRARHVHAVPPYPVGPDAEAVHEHGAVADVVDLRPPRGVPAAAVLAEGLEELPRADRFTEVLLQLSLTQD